MATVGGLVANLTLNKRGFDRGLKGARGGIGAFVKGAIGTLAPLAGAFAAALGGRAAINAAREQIKQEKKLEAVLRATGGAAGLSAAEIKDYAAELQTVTNFGDEATISAAAVLGTFKEIKGDVFKDAIASIQDMSAVLGQDMQAGAVQLGKALNDPIRGVTALSRVGVSFTQQQKDQIRVLQESGDMMGAQRIILDELQGEFGGAARAMAGPFTQAQNVLGDVAEIAGFVLLPALNEVMRAFIGGAGPITDNADSYKELGESIAFVVKDGLTPLVQGVQTAAQFVTDATDTIGYGFRNAADLAQLAMIDAELALFGLVPGAEQAFGQVAGILLGVWEGTAAGFEAFVQNIVAGFGEIKNAAAAIAAGVQAAFDAAFSGKNPLTAFAEEFQQTLASQQNVAGGGNPFAEFGKAFDRTRKDVADGFATQGLGKGLEARREQLLSRIAGREAEFASRQESAAETFAAPSLGPAAGDEQQQQDGSSGAAGGGKDQPVSALRAGSSEAFSAIFAAMRGSQNDPQKQTEKNTARAAQASESAATELQKLTGLLQNGDVQIVGSLT